MGYLIHVTNTQVVKQSSELTLTAVREFSNVFSEELLRVPPNR